MKEGVNLKVYCKHVNVSVYPWYKYNMLTISAATNKQTRNPVMVRFFSVWDLAGQLKKTF
jgi:chloramphenicol O-acetyltransferase